MWLVIDANFINNEEEDSILANPGFTSDEKA